VDLEKAPLAGGVDRGSGRARKGVGLVAEGMLNVTSSRRRRRALFQEKSVHGLWLEPR
jgi:hypothetical protein